MTEKVLKTIREHNMFEKGGSVIAAVSGGADSVALLLVLKELREILGISLYAANLNHNIRGAEADGDSEFVRRLCEKEEIGLFYKSVDIPKIAREEGLGEEECGRRERYRFFDEAAKEAGDAVIATGHHMGDNTETFLFRLFRGSGTKGLCAIPYVRGNIARPLLDVTKGGIEKYLAERGAAWRTDSSNFDTRYSRNMIRHEIIPKIESAFGSIDEKTARVIKCLKADEDYFDKECEKSGAIAGGEIILEKFLPLHESLKTRIAMRALMLWGVSDIDSDAVARVILLAEGGSGKMCDLGGGVRIIKAYETLKRARREKNGAEIAVKTSESGVVHLENMTINLKTVDKCEKMSDNKMIAVFDAEKLPREITVRTRRDGDYIYPFGMKGRKKLKELFIDMKIPRDERDGILLLALGGEIIFIPGIRHSRSFAPEKDTKKFLLVECAKEE